MLGSTGQVLQLDEDSWARGRIWAHTSPVQSGSSSHGSRRASCHLPRIGARWRWGSSWASGPGRWCLEHGHFLETHTGTARKLLVFRRTNSCAKRKPKKQTACSRKEPCKFTVEIPWSTFRIYSKNCQCYYLRSNFIRKAQMRAKWLRLYLQEHSPASNVWSSLIAYLYNNGPFIIEPQIKNNEFLLNFVQLTKLDFKQMFRCLFSFEARLALNKCTSK